MNALEEFSISRDFESQEFDTGIFALANPARGHMPMLVRNIRYQGENLNTYTLVAPDGKELPAFEAGAHVDLYFADGRVRQYSLCNDPADVHQYEITVQREPDGRGGSAEIFSSVRVGQVITISEPRNNFPLFKNAKRHLFLAGGVGITPIKAMIATANSLNQPFELHYCTRTPARTAFRDEIGDLVRDGTAFVHHDGGDPKKGLDVDALLKEHVPGTHLYCCGPGGFMKAVEDASGHWPDGTVHFEYFSVPEPAQVRPGEAPDGDGSFRVRLAKSDKVFDIPPDQSIAEVLNANDVHVPTSCESGLCGTCRVGYLEGQPEHRDYILTDEEKKVDVLTCCARSYGPELVLDI